MIKKFILTLSALLLMFSLTGCLDSDSTSSDDYKPTLADIIQVATTNDGSGSGYFQAHDLNGNYYSQTIFTESEYTFVNIWGTFCGPCINEMPDLGELAASYDSDKIQFVGIICDVYEGYSSQSEYDNAASIIKSTNANYTHLVYSESLGKWKVDECQYVPTTLIVDNNGNIVYETVGSHSKMEWDTIISQYVK